MLNNAKKLAVFIALDMADTLCVVCNGGNKGDGIFVAFVIIISGVYCWLIHQGAVAV